MTVRLIHIILITSILLLTLGCGNSVERAQKDSYEAQENVANKRVKLVEQYQQCVKEAAEDAKKVEACESYLKAAEALK